MMPILHQHDPSTKLNLLFMCELLGVVATLSICKEQEEKRLGNITFCEGN